MNIRELTAALLFLAVFSLLAPYGFAEKNGPTCGQRFSSLQPKKEIPAASAEEMFFRRFHIINLQFPQTHVGIQMGMISTFLEQGYDVAKVIRPPSTEEIMRQKKAADEVHRAMGFDFELRPSRVLDLHHAQTKDLPARLESFLRFLFYPDIPTVASPKDPALKIESIAKIINSLDSADKQLMKSVASKTMAIFKDEKLRKMLKEYRESHKTFMQRLRNGRKELARQANIPDEKLEELNEILSDPSLKGSFDTLFDNERPAMRNSKAQEAVLSSLAKKIESLSDNKDADAVAAIKKYFVLQTRNYYETNPEILHSQIVDYIEENLSIAFHEIPDLQEKIPSTEWRSISNGFMKYPPKSMSRADFLIYHFTQIPLSHGADLPEDLMLREFGELF